MRLTAYCFLLLLLSCKSTTREEKNRQAIEGKWLIVYPDEQLRSSDEERIYAAIQDSLVQLKGLKLVAFEKSGLFYQADHPERKGIWKINDDKRFVIEEGGDGFSPFRATLTQAGKESMILTEFVRYEGESLELDWHLVKMKEKEAAVFFDEDKNKWKQRPALPETEKALKEKLASMLDYYAAYYLYIRERSSYFIPGRVLLPFQFYQHAVGLRPLKNCPSFQQLFFDSAQAARAHSFLENGMRSLAGQFPKSEENSYVHEYALYMKLLAKEMRKAGE